MDLITRNLKTTTPVKDPRGFQPKNSENYNPNISRSSPGPKSTGSPVIKSTKAQKLGSKNPALSDQHPVFYSPRNKIRERKFVVAKKKKNPERKDIGEGSGLGLGAVECKCKERFGGNFNGRKCLCVAYESLRASQEGFFKDQAVGDGENGELGKGRGESEVEDEVGDGYGLEGGLEGPGETGSPTMKRRRDKLLEEARNSVPKFGKVKHLVKAFEKMLTMRNLEDDEEEGKKDEDEAKRKVMQWALPGLQPPPNVSEDDQVSSSSFCPSDLFLTSENLGLDSRVSASSSWDGSQGSISSRTSNGGRRSRRNSSESCGILGGSRWKKKQVKITSQKPFKLRTEQRGKMKEEEFLKKLQEMTIEEERQRIPIAQGLPWTTDEPECLIKPPVKENTRPLDLKLHSDIRAVERAEFDQQVAEKMSLIEQYKMEREREQKMAEEEESRRLRKELIPKAQPMPYFDRPFIPRRSAKHPTIPKEPRFHIPQHKKIKCCLSWNDLSTYSYQQ